jgi:hypothetical protein
MKCVGSDGRHTRGQNHRAGDHPSVCPTRHLQARVARTNRSLARKLGWNARSAFCISHHSVIVRTARKLLLRPA